MDYIFWEVINDQKQGGIFIKKSIILLSLLIIGLVSLGVVSAADADLVSSDISSISEGNSQTFTDLNQAVQSENSTILIDSDYKYDSTVDSSYQNGIVLDDTFNGKTIDGQGHTIDGSNLARIFNITASDFTLKNINFINAKALNGGAIFISGTNVVIDNCTFDSNVASQYKWDGKTDNGGGAIFVDGENAVIKNSKFTNTAGIENSQNGGAIFINKSNAQVKNCEFDGLKSALFAGGVCTSIHANNFVMDNCNFTGVSASNGGAVTISANSTLSNCKFDDCAGDFGNALLIGKGYHNYEEQDANQIGHVDIINGTFINCHSKEGSGAALADGAVFVEYTDEAVFSGNTVFENDTATDRSGFGAGAGALYANAKSLIIKDNLTINNCYVTDDSLVSYGGAIVNYYNLEISTENAIISNNHAEYGGVIFSSGYYGDEHLVISGNVSFINNHADYAAGAIYTGSITDISGNVSFINNTAGEEGGAIYSYGPLSISQAKFENNKGSNGGAVYIADGNATIDNCTFDSNVATSYNGVAANMSVNNGGGAIFVDGENAVIKNSKFTNTAGVSNAQNGGAVFINNTGAQINNCVFEDLKGSLFAGGVCTSIGANDFVMDNCNFTGVSASNGGAVVISANSTLSNCKFDDCAGDFGNALLIGRGTHASAEQAANRIGYANIINGTFINCHTRENSGAALADGAVFIQGADDVVFSGNTLFENDTATDRSGYGAGGGAIYTNVPNLTFKDNLTINNCYVTDDSRQSFGGAIVNYRNFTLDTDNAVISNNHALYGGAIYNSGNITISGDVDFVNNTADSEDGVGGAIYSSRSSNLVISGAANFINNKAGWGGALEQNGGANISITGSANFINNTATEEGGAIALYYSSTYGSATLTGSNVLFEGNTAPWGGAIYSDGEIDLNQSVFRLNNATNAGGAIYCYNATVNNSIFEGNTAPNGKDVVYYANDMGSFDNNYWAMNYTTKEQFNNSGRIAQDTDSGFVNTTPNNWVLMTITAPEDKIVEGKKTNFTVKFDKLTDGETNTTYEGALPDYVTTAMMDGKKVSDTNIPSGEEGSFIATPHKSGKISIYTQSPITSEEEARISINAKKVKVEVPDITTEPGKQITIVINVTDEDGDPVNDTTLDVILPNGTRITVPVIEGKAVVDVEAPDNPGDFHFDVEIEGVDDTTTTETGDIKVIDDNNGTGESNETGVDTSANDSTLPATGNPLMLLLVALLTLPIVRRKR